MRWDRKTAFIDLQPLSSATSERQEERLTPLDAADPTIVNAANPLPLPTVLKPNPTVPPLFLLFARTHLYLYSLSALISIPISSKTLQTCLITSGGGLVVIVV